MSCPEVTNLGHNNAGTTEHPIVVIAFDLFRASSLSSFRFASISGNSRKPLKKLPSSALRGG